MKICDILINVEREKKFLGNKQFKKINGGLKMASATIYVEKNYEHEIECEFSVDIENDGIGPYEYWGFKCYDYGTDYAVLDEIYECRMVRSGRVENKEDAPKCANKISKHVEYGTGKEYYIWTHYRNIKPTNEIENKIIEYIEETPLSELVDYPDYDDCYDDYHDSRFND